ncbi:tetratricopeptide repeat-containing sulfotransferase family protein [Stakelama marina]|uniref:Sulfotransferase n=1 Tax=Stakelama marina TaxID=2826939 RepID=A0A8T4ID24_9SPHN|nr:tetratricopeptide repeat-containing sulfotransferase family protein [Stakelama marina]MBR0552547.1 sulfotransferase [Stakelama marina]
MALAAATASDGEIARLLRNRDWRAAYDICRVRTAENRDDAVALAGLATIAEAHGNLAKALPFLEQAYAAAPKNHDIAAQYARLLSLLSRGEDAERVAGAALADDPQDPQVLEALGVVLSRAGRHDEAAETFAKVVERRPDHHAGWRNYASALKFCGRFADAEGAYDRAIALAPDDAEAWLAKTGLRRQTAADDPTPALVALWEARGDDPDQALRIGHALAKTAEDLGDRASAMEWLAKAKREKARIVHHDPDTTDRLYAAAAQTCTPGDLPAAQGLSGVSPIFVVGAPRTGTTLVDRILSSHPELLSVGESPALSLGIKRLSGTRSNRVLDLETLAVARELVPEAIGRAYVDAIAAAPGMTPALRSVDKMPLNLLYAGLAHRALPDARIVRLRRHPLDAVLANWRQLFAPRFGHYDHNWSLDHVARWIVAVERLAAHWRATLPPDRYFEIGYEDIIADQEARTRQLLDFVGVAWDERCLRFHENEAPVSTASAVQVRQPLHSRSVGAWRGVADHLKPAIDILHDAGLIDAHGDPAGVAARSVND